MGLRGPAKRPAHLKVISGTARPDTPEDLPPVAGEEALTDLPKAPDWMPNDDAREEWRRIGSMLIERGALNVARLTPLGFYCALTGKIAQKFKAGDIPAAHLVAQHKGLAKELGILGGGGTQDGSGGAAGAPKGRLTGIKERSRRSD